MEQKIYQSYKIQEKKNFTKKLLTNGKKKSQVELKKLKNQEVDIQQFVRKRKEMN